MRPVSATPTLDTSAYAAGDACGGLLTFNLGSYGTRTVVLKKAELLDDASTPDSAAMLLHLFTDPAMVCPDQGAFTVTQANFLAGKYLGSIPFTTYEATPVGTNAAAVICIKDDLNKLLPLIGGEVYGQLSCVATPTFAAAQLYVLLHFAEYA